MTDPLKDSAARLRLFNEVMARPPKEREVSYPCRCGHPLTDHDIIHTHKGCDIIGCPCLEFRPKI